MPVDVRIVAATLRNLSVDVREGTFRPDLYYRLAVVPIDLPPLRRRLGDIPALLRHFLAKHAPGRSDRYEVSPETLEVLAAHSWPGNVRELENLVERAVVLGAGPVLGPEDLAPFATPAAALAVAEDARRSLNDDEGRALREAVRRAHGNLALAARMLGIPRGTLLYRMGKHGVPTD